MSTAELAARIGLAALLSVEGRKFQFQVHVRDARMSYGRDQYLVVPFAGIGQTWVSGDRVEFPEGV